MKKIITYILYLLLLVNLCFSIYLFKSKPTIIDQTKIDYDFTNSDIFATSFTELSSYYKDDLETTDIFCFVAIDEKANPVKGITIAFYDEKGHLLSEKETNLQGKICYEHVPLNDKYLYKVTSAPSGYNFDDTLYYLDASDHLYRQYIYSTKKEYKEEEFYKAIDKYKEKLKLEKKKNNIFIERSTETDKDNISLKLKKIDYTFVEPPLEDKYIRIYAEKSYSITDNLYTNRYRIRMRDAEIINYEVYLNNPEEEDLLKKLGTRFIIDEEENKRNIYNGDEDFYLIYESRTSYKSSYANLILTFKYNNKIYKVKRNSILLY